MSSSTALLPNRTKKDEHPIFLRVCHSPWVSINQKLLVLLRWVFAMYMAVTFILVLYYEFNQQERGPAVVFDFSNISYLIQLVYAWIALCWTYMHLNYPHHGNSSSQASQVQKILSPPHEHNKFNNRFFFSLFYSAAVAFPHVVTLVYWLILVPKTRALAVPSIPDIPAGGPDGNVTTPPVDTPVGSTPSGDVYPGYPGFDDIFEGDAFKNFCVVNLYGVNSIIALIEVFFLSSIKRQVPIWAHVVGLSLLSLIYVGWQYVGVAITGVYAYYFFDPEEIGWEFVIIAVVAFAGLTNTFFAFVYGITGFREVLTAGGEGRNNGYIRLPQ